MASGPRWCLPSSTVALASNQAPCQTLLGADEEDGDEDGDHDNVLMDNVADLCGGLCKVAGGSIGADAADALFRAFSRFAQPGRPASDRAMALGCFAELCVELPPPLAAERHFATLQPLFAVSRPRGASSIVGGRRSSSAPRNVRVAPRGAAAIRSRATTGCRQNSDGTRARSKMASRRRRGCAAGTRPRHAAHHRDA